MHKILRLPVKRATVMCLGGVLQHPLLNFQIERWFPHMELFFEYTIIYF